MKKLYRKGTVHPSPPIISDHLSFLPATILTLTVALSPQDREVLAYLISCSSSSNNNNFSPNPNPHPNPRRTTTTTTNNNNNNGNNQKVVAEGDHPPLFHCSCFRCYMSYWARWDSSPNHQLIHEIIDAYEDWLAQTAKPAKTKKKDKRNKKGSDCKPEELKRPEVMRSDEASESVGESSNSGGGGDDEVGEGGDGDGVEGGEEKGSVRRFVSFIGERIWGAWGQ